MRYEAYTFDALEPCHEVKREYVDSDSYSFVWVCGHKHRTVSAAECCAERAQLRLYGANNTPVSVWVSEVKAQGAERYG